MQSQPTKNWYNHRVCMCCIVCDYNDALELVFKNSDSFLRRLLRCCRSPRRYEGALGSLLYVGRRYLTGRVVGWACSFWRSWHLTIISTWAAQKNQDWSSCSLSWLKSSFWIGLLGGSRHGVTKGQPSSVFVCAVDLGALMQPANINRQLSLSPHFNSLNIILKPL